MDNNVGKTIKELRNKKGITQKQLAECIHVSDKTVSHWEKGDNLPPLEMLNRLSKFFDVPLKDLITLRVSEEENESLIQDVVDEFNEVKRKTRKIVISTIVIAISFVAIVLSAYLFSLSYNKFKVYDVYVESDNFYPAHGLYIETRIQDSLFLQNIVLRNHILKNDDIVSIDLYYLKDNKKVVLSTYSNMDFIHFYSKDSFVPINTLIDYSKNLFLSVTIIDTNNNINTYTGKIKFDLNFSNNKIYKNNDRYIKDINLSSEEIAKILLNNNFNLTEANLLWKKTGIYEFKYFLESNKISCNYEKDNLKYKYNLNLNTNTISVSVINIDNIELENYEYDISNDKLLFCKIGMCSSYEEAIKIIDKGILYLIK